jgi:tyramine---L-glutamate ligase
LSLSAFSLMRIFVYEYVSAACATENADTLAVEGWAMLAALLEDFRRIPSVAVQTMLGEGAQNAGITRPARTVVHIANKGEEKDLFHRLAEAADWTLVVAPEFDDILATRLRWIAEAGVRSMNSTLEATVCAGDKLRLAGRLAERGVLTPPTVAFPGSSPSFPAVCKPRYGAGSQATYLVRNQGELQRTLDAARAESWSGDLIVQPYHAGEPVSVSFLIGPGRRLAMPASMQHLSTDGRFRYLGGNLPLDAQRNARAARLATRAIDAVEGLAGYVGVDLVLGASADDDAVIEINPRLTTSYVGLRALARFNMAEAMMAVAAGDEPPRWEWRTDQVRFATDGRLIGLQV